MTAEKGTLIIRAAEQLGIEIPRFCDHPLLDPVAACRMCLIEIEGQPKPQPACAIPVADNMIVRTQRTSKVADEAQRGVMEFLLLNHPLDCPICDKGGVPLQNQAMTAGRSETRFEGPNAPSRSRSTSAHRSCWTGNGAFHARCTRFADEIAGDAFIDLLERGAQQQVGISQDTPFDSYFAGNTVQICPVGALTNAFATGSGRGRSTWYRCPRSASTAPAAARCAPTCDAVRCSAGWLVTTPRSMRSGTATRAGSGSPT